MLLLLPSICISELEVSDFEITIFIHTVMTIRTLSHVTFVMIGQTMFLNLIPSCLGPKDAQKTLSNTL